MVEKEGSVKLFKTILKLMVDGSAFALCPDCKKFLSLFEVYNGNCSFCGEINFGDILMIKGYVEREENEDDKNDDEDEEEDEEE